MNEIEQEILEYEYIDEVVVMKGMVEEDHVFLRAFMIATIATKIQYVMFARRL
ncbi:hypothetical protein HZI73_00500 [Vallitalea pronyensis]|uniref:Uncharacterized protein n=1 Tax=Vallitalea pronyensis TaxID=1348613 RepID=A0A8J8MFZ2_9FIRM|nr:hypothetical protein [Vallitalea pronyensis]QUI20880.1 hypothetical protein HZI73_00500 [Vallitalea pronyensis]